MSKPIIVGYDPQTFDRAPVNFAVAAARFTGAPLVIASVGAGSAVRDGSAAGRLDEDLAADASGALDEVDRELDAEGIAVEFRQIDNTSAARALHEAAEAQDAGLLVVGSTTRGAIGRVLPGSTAERLMHGRRARSRSCRTSGRQAAASTRSAWRTSTPTMVARRCAALTRSPVARARSCAS